MINKLKLRVILFVFFALYGLFALWGSIEGINKFGFTLNGIVGCIGSLVMIFSLPINIKYPRYFGLSIGVIVGLAILDIALRKL